MKILPWAILKSTLLLRVQSDAFVSHEWWQIPRLTYALLYGFLALVSERARHCYVHIETTLLTPAIKDLFGLRTCFGFADDFKWQRGWMLAQQIVPCDPDELPDRQDKVKTTLISACVLFQAFWASSGWTKTAFHR